MIFSSIHLFSFLLTIVLISCLGLYAGRFVKSDKDFTVGGHKAGPMIVAGALLNTIIGGASTVGTAQLAYIAGFSAWWFTLGAGLSLLFMGFFLAGPLRSSGLETISEYLVKGYGPLAGPVTSIFSSIGIFFSLIANTLSATALLTTLLSIDVSTGAFITLLLVVSFVFFGGLWGAGMVGVAKLVCIYISLGVSTLYIATHTSGLRDLITAFPSYPWFSLWGRGIGTDLAAGLSLLVGMVSTQTYIQAIYSARSKDDACWGTVQAGIFVIPTGIAGVLIGLFMRLHHPDINPVQALPLFVLQYLPPWFSGIAMATLLIAAVGSNAGLVLGVSTMLSRDIYRTYLCPQASEQRLLLVSRIVVLGVAILAILFSLGQFRSFILEWNFLSMGLRGAGICLPLLAQILLPGLVPKRTGLYALTAGPLAVLFWKLLVPYGLDPLFAGIMVSSIILVGGTLGEKWNSGVGNRE